MTVLRQPGVTTKTSNKLFAQFASANSEELTKEEFDSLQAYLRMSWGLDLSGSEQIAGALQRWRWRANAAKGTQGLPLWPLAQEDFLDAFPSLLRAVRDWYVPLGAGIHRSLFIRQSEASLGDKYLKGPSLGRGTYGEFCLVTSRITQEKRVCKRVSRRSQRVPSEELESEVNMLRGIDHPHIIRIFEFFEEEEYIEMIMEPVLGGTLTRLVQGLYCDPDGDPFDSRPKALSEGWVAT